MGNNLVVFLISLVLYVLLFLGSIFYLKDKVAVGNKKHFVFSVLFFVTTVFGAFAYTGLMQSYGYPFAHDLTYLTYTSSGEHVKGYFLWIPYAVNLLIFSTIIFLSYYLSIRKLSASKIKFLSVFSAALLSLFFILIPVLNVAYSSGSSDEYKTSIAPVFMVGHDKEMITDIYERIENGNSESIESNASEKPFICEAEDLVESIKLYESDFPEPACLNEQREFSYNKSKSTAQRVLNCLQREFDSDIHIASDKFDEALNKRRYWSSLKIEAMSASLSEHTIIMPGSSVEREESIKSDIDEVSCQDRLDKFNSDEDVLLLSEEHGIYKKLELVDNKIVLQ